MNRTLNNDTLTDKLVGQKQIQSNLEHHLFKVNFYFFVQILEGSMEEEAVDGRLKEAKAEVKEKFTAVASVST